MLSKKYLDELSYNVIGAAIEVPKFLGSGLLESIYHECRCDLFVENCLVVELKSCSEIIPQHHSQLLTYMKLLKAPKGIIINFNSDNIFKNGQETFVNEIFRALPER